MICIVFILILNNLIILFSLFIIILSLTILSSFVSISSPYYLLYSINYPIHKLIIILSISIIIMIILLNLIIISDSKPKDLPISNLNLKNNNLKSFINISSLILQELPQCSIFNLIFELLSFLIILLLTKVHLNFTILILGS